MITAKYMKSVATRFPRQKIKMTQATVLFAIHEAAMKGENEIEIEGNMPHYIRNRLLDLGYSLWEPPYSNVTVSWNHFLDD